MYPLGAKHHEVNTPKIFIIFYFLFLHKFSLKHITQAKWLSLFLMYNPPFYPWSPCIWDWPDCSLHDDIIDVYFICFPSFTFTVHFPFLLQEKVGEVIICETRIVKGVDAFSGQECIKLFFYVHQLDMTWIRSSFKLVRLLYLYLRSLNLRQDMFTH